MKQDWAERKAARITDAWDKRSVYEEIAKALRQERRRAVRKCRKIRDEVQYSSDRHTRERDEAYVLACDDCATAIAGGK